MTLTLPFIYRTAALAAVVLVLTAPVSGFAGGKHGHGHSGGWHSGLAVRPPPTWTLSRTPNIYNYYWNTRLAGIPGGGGMVYPMVYQPTDTTQLGFYYQTVPRWQYRPEMLPPPPAPNWPIGMGYGSGMGWNSGGVVPPSNIIQNNGIPAKVTPVTPAAPAPVVAPPPPAEPAVNVPEPEAAVFPNRARR